MADIGRAHPELGRPEFRAIARVAPDAPDRRSGASLRHPKATTMKVSTMMESIRAAFRREGLVRVKDERVLGGVIAGLGRRVGLDPWPARLLFVLVLMLIPGSQLLIYPVLWILMPQEIKPSSARPAWTTPTA
jgi:phage shock protein PspC (stress-responsive transcriptional regulator)